jgi:rare lipoprotein A
VRVTNLSNSRNILLRINDRGPYFGQRLIDVSWKAAERLGFVDSGTTPVRVEVVARPSSKPSSRIDLISQSRPSSCPVLP